MPSVLSRITGLQYKGKPNPAEHLYQQIRHLFIIELPTSSETLDKVGKTTNRRIEECNAE